MYRIYEFVRKYEERVEARKEGRRAAAEAWANYDKRMDAYKEKCKS